MFYLKGNTSAIVYFLLLINNLIFQEITAQIVGGESTTIEEFPYMVSLRVGNNQHYCGGAIISERHILTAAHCLVAHNGRPILVTVVSGTTRSYGNEGTFHRVLRVTRHPQFARDVATSYMRNDIAVLTLENNIRYSRYAQKINLPSEDTGAGVVATIAGWGYLSMAHEVVSQLLQRAHTTVISNPICSIRLRSEGVTALHEGQICAYERRGVGVCTKDSGGPLAANNVIIGVLTFGVPCARGFPDVFTRVYAYKNWIEEVMARNP